MSDIERICLWMAVCCLFIVSGDLIARLMELNEKINCNRREILDKVGTGKNHEEKT